MKLRDSLAVNKSIRLQAEAETWQDAVKIGVDLLVAADVVEPRYRPRTRAGGDQAQRRCLRNHESGRYGGG